MVMTKTRRAKPNRRALVRQIAENPFAILASAGILEKVSARPALEPWLHEVLGERYFELRARRLTVRQVQQVWQSHMRPGEKLSDLVIAMREE